MFLLRHKDTSVRLDPVVPDAKARTVPIEPLLEASCLYIKNIIYAASEGLPRSVVGSVDNLSSMLLL